MKELLDSIKNPVWKAFAWRVYNTFIAVILPILAGAILTYFDENSLPVAIESFGSSELWSYVLGSVVLTLLGSVTAGGLKANRVESGIREFADSEGI